MTTRPSGPPVTAPRLLLLSNSRDAEGNYLVHPQRELRDFLGDAVHTVLFIPYAGVTITAEAYTEQVRAPFRAIGYEVQSITEATDPVAAIMGAEAIAVGGGNTFNLLAALQARDLLAPIRERVRGGVPYVGWSAGSVVACPTIQTTNDMPIVAPRTLEALGLISFQINAHYTDFHPPGFQGETRAQRLTEYLAVNPEMPVLGLPEGTMLRVEGDTITLLGGSRGVLYRSGEAVRYVEVGERVSV